MTMTALRRVLAGASWLLLAACTKTEHVTAEPAPVSDADKAFPSPSPLPEALAVLGKPCASLSPSPQRAFECGQDARAAIVSSPLGASAPGFPPAAVRIVPRRATANSGAFVEWPVAELALERGRLWARESCAICRIDAQRLTVVDLALATDTQLQGLQARLDLPKSPVLRSARAFQDALARQGT
jgi:hypothetical protein